MRLNFEFNVECYNEDLANDLTKLVENRVNASHEVTLQEVDSRRLPVRLMDGLARLASPYL
jgi:cardiolipin synthase